APGYVRGHARGSGSEHHPTPRNTAWPLSPNHAHAFDRISRINRASQLVKLGQIGTKPHEDTALAVQLARDKLARDRVAPYCLPNRASSCYVFDMRSRASDGPQKR
ncbi:MAG TPA: hypothetical protein VKR56_00745, partial [Candidatus Cybelea sp.]|nr:hypothetical protein [Candidatus Cybelea sp.]